MHHKFSLSTLLFISTMLFASLTSKAQYSVTMSTISGTAPTVTAVKATKSTSPYTVVNFTFANGRWSAPAQTGTWFISIYATGTFGSLIHESNIPNQEYMAGGSGSNWYAVWDAPFSLTNNSNFKIYTCSTTYCY